MKISLSKAKRWGRECLKETIIFADAKDAWEYMKNNPGYELSLCGKENEFKVFIVHDFEPTPENKMRVRGKFSADNPAYAICAACGKELHANNMGSHWGSIYGVIGPECAKKIASAKAIAPDMWA